MKHCRVDIFGDLGLVIRDVRKSAGFTQQQLAERLGTTQSAVSRWENGTDVPRLASLQAILRACGLTGSLVLRPLDEPDDGVDRTQIRQQLAMTPDERLASVVNLSKTLATASRAR